MALLVQSTTLKRIKTGTVSASAFDIVLYDRFLEATPEISGLPISFILYTYKCNLQVFDSAATWCGNASWFADYQSYSTGGAMSFPGGGVRDFTSQGVVSSVYNSVLGTIYPFFNITITASRSITYVLYIDCFVSFFG